MSEPVPCAGSVAMATQNGPSGNGSANSVSRREMIVGSLIAAGAWLGYRLYDDKVREKSPVFVARNQKYEGDLVTTIRDGLLATGVDPAWIKGRRVLLKPNMVEPRRDRPQMTTHPAVLSAAIEVFAKWDAEVVVGEAPGHVRDTEMALVESGLIDVIEEHKVEFADLNYEETRWVPNVGRQSSLEGFWMPGSIVAADLVVSMPKLKTHHWVGMTCSTKNFYGVLPGSRYGWPKNVLHHNGIPETIADIQASVPNKLAIVDGIVCMEGDGPILGSPKPMGLLAMGRDLASVDATCARIIGMDPARMEYLQLVAKLGGAINERHIVQRGEDWKSMVNPFQILDLPHIKYLRPRGIMTTKRYPCGKVVLVEQRVA